MVGILHVLDEVLPLPDDGSVINSTCLDILSKLVDGANPSTWIDNLHEHHQAPHSDVGNANPSRLADVLNKIHQNAVESMDLAGLPKPDEQQVVSWARRCKKKLWMVLFQVMCDSIYLLLHLRQT